MAAENTEVKIQSRKAVMPVFCLCLMIISSILVSFAVARAFDAQLKGGHEIGVSDLIEIGFSQPVLFISADNIKITPDVGFTYRLSENREALTVIPEGGLTFEKKYTITLEGVRGIDGAVLDGKVFVVYTGQQKTDAKNTGMKSGGAAEGPFGEMTLSKDRYVPPEISQAKAGIRITPHIISGKYIDVSIAHQIMTLFEDGAPVNQFLVSTGKIGMPTPQGQFAVRSKERNHWSYTYKLWMPYSLNFSGPFFIHELPYWPNGYHEGANHLGRRVSHGCVRLGIGPAKYVFDWVEIGTPVYIHQ